MRKGSSSKSADVLTPKEERDTENILRKIVNDPLRLAGDPEFASFATAQFQNVFGTDPVERDETGKTIPPRAKSARVDPFKPSITRDDLHIFGPVVTGSVQERNAIEEGAIEGLLPGAKPGRSAKRADVNDPANVLKLQKALSNTGDFSFDLRSETSGRLTERLAQAIRKFQKRNGLKVDGRVNPDGPTIETMGHTLFTPDGTRREGASDKAKFDAVQGLGAATEAAVTTAGKSTEQSDAQRATAGPGQENSIAGRSKEAATREHAHQLRFPTNEGETANGKGLATTREKELAQANGTRPIGGAPQEVDAVESETDKEEKEQIKHIRAAKSAIILTPERQAEIETSALEQTEKAIAQRLGENSDDTANAFAGLRAAQKTGDANAIKQAARDIAGLIQDAAGDPVGFITGDDSVRRTAANHIIAAAEKGDDAYRRILDLTSDALGLDDVKDRRADLEHAERIRVARSRLRPDRAGFVGNPEMGDPGVPPIERVEEVRTLARELRNVADMSDAEFADFLTRGAQHIKPEEFEQFEVIAEAVRSGDLFWVRGQRIVERDYAPRTTRDDIIDTFLDSFPVVGDAREAVRFSEALTEYFDAEEAGDEEIADEAAGEIIAVLAAAPLGFIGRVPGLRQVMREIGKRTGPEARQAIRRFLRKAPQQAFREGRPTAGRILTAIYARRRTWLGRMADNALALDARIIGTPGEVRRVVSGQLARRMLRELGVRGRKKWTGYQAHHIIPKKMQDHPALKRAGYDMDHPANGIFLRAKHETGKKFRLAAHPSNHAKYSKAVEEQLDKLDLNAPPELLARQIRAIREHARKGLLKELPLNKNVPGYQPDAWREHMTKLRIPQK